MPAAATLEAFIAAVERGDHVKAIENFYTANATMRENQTAPRNGRTTLMAHESAVLARTASVVSTCVHPVFVNGDHVVIRWMFRFEWQDGTVTLMEELAYQRWERERIAQEQFFYDPAQRVPKQP